MIRLTRIPFFSCLKDRGENMFNPERFLSQQLPAVSIEEPEGIKELKDIREQDKTNFETLNTAERVHNQSFQVSAGPT